jgi:hypothetical protein
MVLGAGALLQPAGAARAEPAAAQQKVSGWDPDKNGQKVTPVDPALKQDTDGSVGQYTRKKLPGRMKSGQITIDASANSGIKASAPITPSK